MALTAAVFRDGAWGKVAAAQVVPGDLLKLSLGSVVAADARLVDGEILLDQSMLAREFLPIEADLGSQTYAGALVQRGEANAEANRHLGMATDHGGLELKKINKAFYKLREI